MLQLDASLLLSHRALTMASLPSLPVLLLSEAVLLLLIILFFVGMYIHKQKAMLKKMMEINTKLKECYEQKNEECEGFYTANKKENKEQSIADYLALSVDDAKQRYERYSEVKSLAIDPAQPYAAKIAALRYFYLTAEQEVYQERGVTHAGWGLFERKLADVASWFAKDKDGKSEESNEQLSLLQAKIDALKPFEEEAKRLQHKVNASKSRQENLERSLKDSKAMILSLQKTLSALKNIDAMGGEVFGSISPTNFLAVNEQRVDSISEVSSEKDRMLRNLIVELNNHHSDINPAVKNRMEASIKMMEIEMMKSDQYISNLKKELKDARLQTTNYALMLSENRDALRNGAGEHGALNAMSPNDYFDSEKIMLEIKQLRGNNTSQRSLISTLEQEIELLRTSIITSDDSADKTIKQQEVDRLSKLLKECEGCIEILEDQVEHLYSQLSERGVGGEVDGNANNVVDGNVEGGDELDIVKLGVELEEMSKEMENILFQYRQTHSVNQFVYDVIRCETLEDVSKNIIQFFDEYNVPAGFCIKSGLGEVEYFRDNLFNEMNIALVKSFTIVEPVFYLDDGTLFSSKKVCFMLLSLASKNVKKISETTLQGIMKVVEVRVQQLDSVLDNSYPKNMSLWIETTKNHLSDLDIQYAYQLEENKKTYNSFIQEIRQAYPLLNLNGSGAVLLDNAINEYEQRMYLLLSSGDAIDAEITKLVDHINTLKTD